MPEIALQPKQAEIYDLLVNSRATVIGIGGGRGAAKSSGADRVIITLMYEQKDLVGCLMMRNWDQVYKYHVEPIRRDFGWLEPTLKTSMPAKLRVGKSELDFSYAENYDDVERRFRSANYRYILIDQAEQFSEREIREIRKACRTKGKQPAKLVLLFNMRGSGIQTLRKWFHLREFNKDEDPDDYAFLKVNPWDNIEWVRPALEADGYTEYDYYAWTDEQRRDYAATRGEYTRQLATDDETIRAADWFGGWDSLEGAYFANSFDLEATRINPARLEQFRKAWAVHWLSQDWGKAHWNATYWFFRVTLSPSEAERYLGWTLEKPINVTVVYREMIVSEKESSEVALDIVQATPAEERGKHKSFYLSPDAFGEKDSANTIAIKESRVLRAHQMPGATEADNDRIGGHGLMGDLFKATKGQGYIVDGKTGKRVQAEDCIFISSECVELLKAIPMLMRDPKNIDDVLKTDKGVARLEMDCADSVRYGLKSMLRPRKKSEEDVYKEKMDAAGAGERMMLAYRRQAQLAARPKPVMPPTWRANIR